MEDYAREEQFDEHGGQRQQIVGENAGGEHVGGAHGSNVETAEDALLAEHDQHGAEAPEAAHDVQCDYGAEEEADHTRVALSENSCVQEEHAQRKDDAEEEKHFVAQGQLNAHAREAGKISQSRSLRPVISMKTSSKEGVAISRLTNSLPSASRCFTSETIACGGRWVCRT